MTKFTELANFTYNEKQLEAWNTLFDNRCKYLLYGGAAHGGKSYFLRWAALGLGMYYFKKYGLEGVPIGLFSEDYPTLKDRQIARIKREFPDWLGRLRDDRDEGYIFEMDPEYGGAKILLRNLDDPSKYASAEFAAILVEELTKNPVETFEDLRFRLRYTGLKKIYDENDNVIDEEEVMLKEVKFIGVTNPGQIGHAWVRKLWIEPDPKNPDPEQDRFIFISSLPTDNPYTTREYIKQLESMPEAKRKAWLEGSWDVFEGQVFTEWNRNLHVIDPIPIQKEWKIYGAIDLGWNKPFSAGWYAVTPDGRTYLLKEYYGNSDWFEKTFGKPMTARRLARILNATSRKMGVNVEYWVGDPAMWNRILDPGKKNDPSRPEGESYAEIMMNAGLKMVKGDNNRDNGRAKYREMLSLAQDGLPYYQIFSTNYDTIRTIPALVYDKNRVEDVDTNAEDHCYDRDRYFFMSRPGKPNVEPRPERTSIQEDYARRKSRYRRKQEGYENYEDEEWAAI